MIHPLHLLLLAVFLLPQAALAAPGLPVIELFSTQSCRSCPPGDALFAEITAQESAGAIALGCHVTFLDASDWKDTLGQAICDERHETYFDALNFNVMETPQIVINGRFDAKGTNRRAITDGIKMARVMADLAEIQLGLRGDELDITLPDSANKAPQDIWVFGYVRERSVAIGGGQNAGQTISYAYPVVFGKKLDGLWTGGYRNMSVPVTDVEADGFVVIAQDHESAAITASGRVEHEGLPPPASHVPVRKTETTP